MPLFYNSDRTIAMAITTVRPWCMGTFIDTALPVVVEPVEPADVVFVPEEPVVAVPLEALAAAGLLNTRTDWTSK